MNIPVGHIDPARWCGHLGIFTAFHKSAGCGARGSWEGPPPPAKAGAVGTLGCPSVEQNGEGARLCLLKIPHRALEGQHLEPGHRAGFPCHSALFGSPTVEPPEIEGGSGGEERASSPFEVLLEPENISIKMDLRLKLLTELHWTGLPYTQE